MKKITIFTLLLLNFEMHAANFEVKMLNQGASGVMVFEPAFLKINTGDTVTFLATDAAHNSASIPGMLPNGASSWNGELSRDIVVTFDVPGVYGYQCTPHSMMAMVGVIQVGDNNANLDNVRAAAESFKSTFVMNQSRLDDLLLKL
ncbi:MAG: pseudoazurin [Gammaproteobacteria bacterium]|mgnify:FL=1|nr:pseudoazurin [Gammaproteobacteria bacterium]|tara:strand:+ start:685 stop:1122 length:438 start_codon:yes stop_codon:yes gene_type:complete